jgi:hypothetical protein
MQYFRQNGGRNSLTFFNEMQEKGVTLYYCPISPSKSFSFCFQILQRTGESMKNRFKFLHKKPEEYFVQLEKVALAAIGMKILLICCRKWNRLERKQPGDNLWL